MKMMVKYGHLSNPATQRHFSINNRVVYIIVIRFSSSGSDRFRKRFGRPKEAVEYLYASK